MDFVLVRPVMVSQFVMRVPMGHSDSRNREIPEEGEEKRRCAVYGPEPHRY